MTDHELLERVTRLEVEAADLRKELERRLAGRPVLTLGSLRGIYSHLVPLSDEELQAAKYHFEWEGETIY
ncbi:MAG: hypothetical protein HYU66_08875 [Armatimonadetes bacterium]|nr:hypothetical protein [Armatimonadota bacterium]